MLTEKGGLLSDHLVALGALDPHDLFGILQKKFSQELLNCFQFFDGRFFFYQRQTSTEPALPLEFDLLELIKEGIYKYYLASTLEWIFEPYYNRPITKATNPKIRAETLQFSPQEARIYSRIGLVEDLWSLVDELRLIGVAEIFESQRFLFYLSQIDVLLFDGRFLGAEFQEDDRLLHEGKEEP